MCSCHEFSDLLAQLSSGLPVNSAQSFLFCFLKTKSCYIAQAGLEYLLLLPLLLECWDYGVHLWAWLPLT